MGPFVIASTQDDVYPIISTILMFYTKKPWVHIFKELEFQWDFIKGTILRPRLTPDLK